MGTVGGALGAMAPGMVAPFWGGMPYGGFAPMVADASGASLPAGALYGFGGMPGMTYFPFGGGPGFGMFPRFMTDGTGSVEAGAFPQFMGMPPGSMGPPFS